MVIAPRQGINDACSFQNNSIDFVHVNVNDVTCPVKSQHCESLLRMLYDYRLGLIHL